MQSKEKVSIIIPCYNDHLYIVRAVESAVAQTWPVKEIILIDDGSNEQTKIKLRSLKKKIDKLISQANEGVSAARNRGIEAASGEYILVLDSDDYFEPDFCKMALDAFRQDEEIKLVTCYSNWFDEKSSKLFRPLGGKVKDALFKNIAMGSSMFRKRNWEEVGGYDEKMLKGFEDWEFYIRLLKSGGQAYVIQKVLFNYRNKANSRNKKANMEKYAIKEYIYNKHADLYKEHFSFFIHEWLKTDKKREAFKQQVMNSLDYKVGNKILKPLRLIGLFKKNRD
ncbi:glycosyl transferase family 2 [Christiangramia fulva]|uniref:Glycosyl transferase family 2 n=1 Tax=Christiangramia fulva TaxID=2126553 RepID=A0A2R3Z0Q4_9FLAO|nr:glycosyltransferase family A protein [Christiangramia fulva]AVR43839.1 glycosyl transferase family 2 [Christiangramia fulva]